MFPLNSSPARQDEQRERKEHPVYHHASSGHAFDTDCAATVRNLAYLRFIETARTLLAEQMGMNLRSMAGAGEFAVVVRTEIDYRASAVLGDRLRCMGVSTNWSEAGFGWRWRSSAQTMGS